MREAVYAEHNQSRYLSNEAMNWTALGAIAELIGGLAVLITLIYLAVQVRQNTAVARETILRNQTDRNMDNSKFIAATPGLMDI